MDQPLLSVFSRHAVSPRAEFTRGPIIVPKNPVPLNATRLIAQVNSFGFTGSICSMIIESPVHTTCPPPNPSNEGHRFFLPFSAKTQSALFNQVVAVCSWALKTNCSLADLAAILGLCRDHHAHRHSASVVYPEDLIRLEGDAHSHSLDEQTGKAMAFPDDDRITLRLLNLSGVDESMRDGLLDEMVQSGRLVDAATLLYNRGHHLHFSAVYNKHDIDMKMLRAFPLYPFDRQRYWRDGHPRRNIDSMATLGLDCPTPNGHPSISDTKSPDSSSKQKEFLSLIEQFGAPVSFDDTPKLPREEGSFHILLTGGNGMLGSNLLARLLRHNSTTVYCIVRGQDPWSKLSRSFKVHHLDEKLLLMARESGSLVLLPTSDLCGPKLGLTDAHYQQLIESVDHIVHAAWKVNFNLPLKEFVPFLECTRALAELSLTAKKLVRYLFIGTYASTFNYSDRLVPEDILEPLVSFAAAQGYAVSKLIAENALLKVLEASLNSFELAIVRVGQICGDSVSGYWSPDEMMPMMIASLPTLKALPRSMPDVSWIPSDVCADSLRDFILFHAVDITVIPPNPHILHVANPRITPWPTVAKQLGNVAGIDQIALLPFADYVPLLQRIPKDLPIVRLLPFFLESLYEGTMRENYASLNVESTLHYSQSLSACPEIGPKILRTIWRHLQSKGQAAEMQKLADPMYIFGPWSALSQEVPLDKNLTRIKALAQTVRASLDDNIDEEDLALERQLKTLACHLTEVEKLSNHGTNPCAVLGYCFGEYSAAVVSGAISEEAAVNIIVRRAIALRKVNGAMLNVFSDMNVVKRRLARLPSPPSIAIHAGPGHVVLSGTTSQIQDAQKELQRHSVKTVLIPDALPFHSDAVNGSLSKLLPYSFLPQPASTCYISCVTGSSISGIQLGVKYWLRHMREPVQFYRSMQFIRNTFPSVKIIDIGPGTSLAKMISRYEWPDTAVLSPDEWCRDVCSYSKSTPITAPTKAPQLDNMPRSLALAGERKHGKEQDLSHVALSVLSETFGYPESTDVLGRSPHSVGLQSMDFIRFSDIFSRRTGIDIPLSAFVSDLTLEKIIINAAT